MNQSFITILNASEEDRRGLFIAAANRLGVPFENIEKDFWVCLVLDLLFNNRADNSPRLLFKGGTSLSKAYSLISRFSEDIDITVFREDLDLDMKLDELAQLSGKQQRKYFDKIKNASQQYICYELKPHLQLVLDGIFETISHSSGVPSVVIDQSDESHQTLLLKYSSLNHAHAYVMPTVKIECGAKSALDPHQVMSIKPYVADDMQDPLFTVNNIVTIEAERTFWDKIIILHGIRRWFDIKGVLRQNGHRYSRHYYDVYKLLNSETGQRAFERQELAIDCSQYAQVFFNSSALDLKTAYIGTFSIAPSISMIKELKKDYEAMSGMVFGQVPAFEEVVDTISAFERKLNDRVEI
ncbi:MAG: nucleotidyl transferase AbiEii/AbiGii toxin family protein [Legionellaceae bacterium]|nr:nucleotidyl transferase AbiEii/AbiGii toxin family protein [Legionellaceae bacterium]